MKNLKRFALPIVFAPLMALAGPPVKYPACAKDLKIKQVTNGAGVFFDENCTVAYVLPPIKGKFEINGLTQNLDLKLCNAYESALNSVNSQYKRLEMLLTVIEKGGGSNDTSIDDDTTIDGIGSNSKNEVVLPAPIDPKILLDIRQTKELIDISKEVLSTFDDKKGVSVGTINYLVNWNKLVTDYQKANPQINFVRLSVESAKLSFTRKSTENGEPVPGVVSQNVPGLFDPSNPSNVVMGDALTGQVVLNYAGACPFVKNGKIKADLNSSDLDKYLSANFTYKYSLQGLRKYRASYNLAAIAQYMRESKTSGGFFSTKTTNSVNESNWSEDKFKLEIFSDQVSYEYDDALRAELKSELVNRVLREMVAISGQTMTIPELKPPPAHGATVAAGTLAKCPHLYCQIGAAGILILDSVFGNSTAVASYIKQKNGVVVDDVSDRRMFSYEGTMVFSGDQNEIE